MTDAADRSETPGLLGSIAHVAISLGDPPGAMAFFAPP
jgi:hypothetical protein